MSFPRFNRLCTLAVTLAIVTTGLFSIATAAPASAAEPYGYGGWSNQAGVSVGSSLYDLSDGDLNRTLDGISGTGRKWLRMDLYWAFANPSWGTYSWGTQDRVVRAATARGLQVIFTAAYTPQWARPWGTSDKTPPNNPADFGTFMWQAAKHFAPMGVHHWEMWHQPNIKEFWAPKPDPWAYANLLGQGSSAVRGADSSAVVISGGLATASDVWDGSRLSAQTFVDRLYDAGARSNFDALGVNPSTYPNDPLTPGTPLADLWRLHDVMSSRGDGNKQIWAMEFSIPTGGSWRAVSESGQAVQLDHALDQMAQWWWAGPLLYGSYRDGGSDWNNEYDNFGLVRRDFSAKPALRSLSGSSGGTAPAPQQVQQQAAAAPVAWSPTALTGSIAGFSGSWQMLWQSDWDLDRELDAMASSGAKWLRMDLDWPSVQPTRESWNWGATDRVVNKARQRGLNVLLVPAFTPQWNRPAGTDDKYAPWDRGAYANFVGAAVRRYAPMGVRHWEIWNEPNQSFWWKPAPDPWAYTDLLKRAYSAVKAADPGATVISAGMAPAPDAWDGSQVNALTFVRRMYENGAKGNFDALGMHPYSFPTSPLAYHPLNAFSGTTPALHDLMNQWGDGWKKIWLTEFGAPTGGGWGAVDEWTQGQQLDEAYTQVAKWPWAGPLFLYLYRDSGWDWWNREENFGLVRKDYTAKQAWWRFTSVMQRPLPN